MRSVRQCWPKLSERTLNRDASVLALASDLSAMTDVTGFGLLGHLHEMTLASGVAAEISAEAVPAIPGVLELLASDQPPIAGGSRRNREWVEPWTDWDPAVPEERRWLLCDAMTSGGLLVALSDSGQNNGRPRGWARIGSVSADGDPGRIRVR